MTVVRYGRFAWCRSLSWAGSNVGRVATETDPVRARYEDLVDALMGIDGVTPPRGGSGFGRSALRYNGKIFAMFVRGRLVLKLPADRVTGLAESCDGVPFDANKGTPMREWLSLDPGSGQSWQALAEEAIAFARER